MFRWSLIQKEDGLNINRIRRSVIVSFNGISCIMTIGLLVCEFLSILCACREVRFSWWLCSRAAYLDYSHVSAFSQIVDGEEVIVFRLSGCFVHIPCTAQASLHSLLPPRSVNEPVLGAKLLWVDFYLMFLLSKSQ